MSSKTVPSNTVQPQAPVFGEAGHISTEELQLATRNHGLPLEILRHARTPTGLHYLLTHYDIPHVDVATWVLEVGGAVTNPLRLTLDALRALPATTLAVTMECAGNGRALLDPRPVSQPWIQEAVGTSEWTGTSLSNVLAQCGLDPRTSDVVFTGLDRGVEGNVEQPYERALPMSEAHRPEVILAYEMNGQPLPPQHGAPLRLVTPGWYGMTNVKWLARITASREPFTGYQQESAYRLRATSDERGTPLTRMYPRALMVPPGIPEFATRRRFVPTGTCRLHGRAWSGFAAIAGVQVSVDDGHTWAEAEVAAPDLGRWAWQSWEYPWNADTPGEHVVRCRARDAAGNTQGDLSAWNVGGYANPAPQRVHITVQAPTS